MSKLIATNSFKKDLILSKKRGKNINKLLEVLRYLEMNHKLPSKYRNHKLKGDYRDYWECHIEPDWLLIYKYTDEGIELARLGSHSNLF